MRSRTSPLKAFAGKAKLQKISGELKKASNMHAGQAKKIDSMLSAKKSPVRGYVSDAQRKAVHASKAEQSPMKGKLKPCQKAAARKKFDVYPSAYANMWASNHKC